jgi:transcription elongation factor GreB
VHEVAEAAAQGDRSENAEYIYGKKRLREIDRRLRFLTKRLDDSRVLSLDETPADAERVFFGAIVTVQEKDGARKRYQLVGPDEARPERGCLSYQSPLGRVLLGRRLGDAVTFSPPAGEVELQIIDVIYGSWLEDE